MYLGNIFKYTLFLLLLYLATSILQIITEIDVPELQLLASNLKPEECVKLVSLHSQSSLSDEEIQKLAEEQSCFRRLVKWICQLRTVTKNTCPIVNDLLERIGREDLVACHTEHNMKPSKTPKVIREVQLAEDSEDDEGAAAIAAPTNTSNATNTKSDSQNLNQTTSKISAIGRATFNVSLRTAGIVIASTILLTCCCTLFVRNRLANLCSKIFRRKKKKKGKLIAIDTDDAADVSRSYYMRKPRAKRKRAPSYELINTGTQNTMLVAPAEPEEPPPTGCYKCYKKKRKKSTRRPHR